MKDHYRPKLKTKFGAGTVVALSDAIDKTRDFCGPCSAVVPSTTGLPGCNESVSTAHLVKAGDVTTEHIARNADEVCFILNPKLSSMKTLRQQN